MITPTAEHIVVADLTELTVEVVSAFVAKNSVSYGELPKVIASVHAALSNVGKIQQVAPEKPVPPVSIRKSVTPDYLISLEDGREYKSLKRHLAGRGLTPQEYRLKWGLPSDYPMVAASYAAQRSQIAKAAGLGRKREMIAPAKRGGKARKSA